ncbi:MAG: DUF3109 family protein [Bacteroidales bacterium]|nr:DUF3109 family protein [Bacteroidales bacterium]
MVQIGDILVSEDVISEYFACDYERCKGRCCIEGDSGAPLDEAEIDGLERDYPQFCSLMSEGGKQAVLREGFFSVDRDGDLVTPLVEGSCECAYSHFTEDGSCLCAIECCKLRKPLSCSLYPIRVTPLTGGGKALNLHRWDICADAFAKGRREGIRVYQFLHKPLVQAFGQEFYEALCAAAGHINSSL